MRHKMEVASLYVLTPKANNDKQRRVRCRDRSTRLGIGGISASQLYRNMPHAELARRRKARAAQGSVCTYFAQGEFGRSQAGLAIGREMRSSSLFARGEVAQLLEVDEVPLLYEWSCSIACSMQRSFRDRHGFENRTNVQSRRSHAPLARYNFQLPYPS